MSWGIGYLGSKSRIADDIVTRFPLMVNLYDLFGGGGAITHCALNKRVAKNYYYNDLNTDVVNLLRYVFSDEFNFKEWQDRWVSREDFLRLKDTNPLIRYVWSFGNNGKDYLYARVIEDDKRLMHNLCQLHQAEEFEKKYNVKWEIPFHEDYRENKKHALKLIGEKKYHLQQLERLQHLQHLQHLERLQRLERLKHLHIYNASYSEILINCNSVVYCDIPYRNTHHCGYAEGKFNYEQFYDWCRDVAREDVIVMVSEYTMPEDFISIWEKNVKSFCNNKAKGSEELCQRATEKLWILKKQEKRYNDLMGGLL